MLSNYHTHTQLCKHATGYIDDYLSVGKKEGLKVLGFSDHCPYPKDGLETWSHIRMTKEQSHQYIQDIKKLSKNESIQVFAGFECEWDFRYESWYKGFLLSELGADYLAFGPHWVYDSGTFVYAPEISTKKQLFTYFDSVIEGITSGIYAFLAHPDLLMATGRPWDDNIEAGFKALIEASIQYKVPLEINGQGLSRQKIIDKGNGKERYQYPHDKFWELVVQTNSPVICNSDAHFPEKLVKDLILARDYATQFGLEIIESLNV